MNCQDFETIIIEVARDRLMDAMERERALEHIRTCGSCATLLVEERALSRDLRALSAQSGAEEIPARLETALLTAFRQRAAAPNIAPAASGRRRWLLVAAMALITFGLSLAGWIALRPEREAATAGPTSGGVAPTPTVSATPEKSSQPPPPQVVAVQHPGRPIPASIMERRQKRLALAGVNRRSASDDIPREFVTRFFPIMQGSELIPLESGQIVRVRMPRSNLATLGIPFNQERASETIRADVLVSNDGLARAIRLVY